VLRLDTRAKSDGGDRFRVARSWRADPWLTF
jgi:hypothetical protein